MKKDLSINHIFRNLFFKRFLIFFVLLLAENTWAQTNPTPFDLSTGSFAFSSQTATNTTYPTNMQGWATSGNNIATAETNAPGGDQTLVASGSASTSGLSNLGASGFNFLSTSSAPNRVVGSICVALNTTNRTNITLGWVAADQSATASLRTMSLTLQYRVGTSGTFTTVSSTTYTTSTSSQAAAQTFSGIVLPSACENVSNLQLRWIYYENPSGQSGTRDAIRLDDITASSSSSGITSTKSGNWSDPTTWVGGVVPTSSNNVIIASGHTVTMDNATYSTRNSGTTTTVNGILITGMTYANNGTTTINGAFQLNNGGYASGTAFSYAATGSTLIFNSGSVYGVGPGNAFWPTTNSPSNVTINSGSGAQLNTAVGAVNGTLTLNGQLNASTAITVNGTLQLNSGGYISSNAPVYGAASTLLYNTTYGVATEWTGTGTTAGAGIPNNVTIQNSAAVTYSAGSARGMAGNLNIISGSLTSGDILNVKGNITNAGNLTTNAVANVTGTVTNSGTFNSNNISNVTGNFTNTGTVSLGGDLKLAANWANALTFNPNGKAVFFNGAGTQTITNTNSANSNTETFNYLVNDKSAGTLQLISNVILNGTLGDVLQLLSSANLDLNGKTLTLSGDNGNIIASGGVRNIISGITGGVLSITGNKVITSASSGTLVLGSTTNPGFLTVVLNKGLNFGAGNLTTVNGVLQINANGYADLNAPKYSNTSSLVYNSVNPYSVNIEWIGNSNVAGIGIPQNVTLNSSNIIMPAGARGLAGLLTINNGSTINLEGTVGSDLSIGGNFVNSGTLNANNRAVIFNGTAAQTITGATTFAYLTLNNSLGLTLSGTTSSAIVNNTLVLTAGKITLGVNNLTVGSSGSITGISSSNYIITASTGQLKRTVGSGAVVFPVGSATAYNPIIFTNAGTSDVYGVILTPGVLTGVNDAASTVKDKWFVSEAVAGGSTLTVVPQWNTTDQDSNFASGTQAYVGFYDGTTWTQNAATVSGSNPYTATGASAFTPTTLSGTQYFAVGKDNGFKCGVAAITYSQGFNSATIPACWSKNNVAVQTSSNLSFVTTSSNPPATPQEGTYMVKYDSFNADAGSEERLNSLPLSSVGIGSVDVEFYMYNDTNGSSYTSEGIQIQYSLDGVTWNDVSGAFFQRYTSTSNGWNLKKVTLPASCANASTFYVGFKFHSGFGYNMYIDNVVVKQSPPTLFVDGTSSAALSFGSNEIGSTVTAKTFSLTGASLTGYPSNITITAPNTDFQVSSDGTTWGSSATVAYTSANLSAHTISVKYIPSTCGTTSSGNLTFSGGGVTTPPTVTVSGTAVLAKPVTNTTDITATTFTANWAAVSGAASYVIDVSTSSTFGTGSTGSTTETFEGANVPATYPTSETEYTLDNGLKWKIYRGQSTTTSNTGSKGLQLSNTSGSIGYIISPSFTGITTVDIYAKRNGSGTATAPLYVYKIVGSTSTLIATLDMTINYQKFTVNVNESSAATIRIINGTTNVANIDDVLINYNTFVPSFVSGYNNLNVGNINSYTVTGLNPNTTYYYRVRAVNGSCISSNSDTQTVLTNNTIVWNNSAWTNGTGPTATLDAIVRTPYYVGDDAVQVDFTTKNLTVESTGLLEIRAGHSVTVAGNITTANDKIIIDSDGSLLQTQLLNNNNTNIVLARRKVKMKTADYTYWSSPVKDQVLLNTTNVNAANSTGGFSEGTPNNRTYRYNEPDDTFKAATELTFTTGKGYAIRGKSTYGTVFTEDQLQFRGELHNGDYSIQIQKSKNTTSGGVSYEHGYNLIGNPYPSNIDFIKFYNLDKGSGTKNSDLIFGKAWFWTNVPGAPVTQGGSAYTPNNYATITLAGGASPTSVQSTTGTPTPNEFIKVSQGFIVQMRTAAPTGSTATLGTLKFDNSIRTNNTTGHFYNSGKVSESQTNRFWVNLISPYNIVNTILIAHMDGATNAYDADYDADLLSIGDDSFYSKLSTQKLQIQARSNPFSNDDVIPLGSKYSANGTYKISLGKKEGVFEANQKIYLVDKLNNTYTDLTSQDYSFTASKGTDDTRFEIVYRENSTLGTDAITKTDFTVYKDGQVFVIKSSNNLGKVELYNTAGILIGAKSSSQKEIRWDTNTLPSGVYIIKAENSGNIRTKKIIK